MPDDRGIIAAQMQKLVLATLWPVADASTAAFMREFYQAHKVDHLDKADALRHAQLALLHGSARIEEPAAAKRGLTRVGSTAAANYNADPKSPFTHPFYWAPFILMGNGL